MQATRKNTAPFLATTRQLTNKERLWQWERRKRQAEDIEKDDENYLLVWIVMFGFAVLIA